jgi:hypothetical protein
VVAHPHARRLGSRSKMRRNSPRETNPGSSPSNRSSNVLPERAAPAMNTTRGALLSAAMSALIPAGLCFTMLKYHIEWARSYVE